MGDNLVVNRCIKVFLAGLFLVAGGLGPAISMTYECGYWDGVSDKELCIDATTWVGGERVFYDESNPMATHKGTRAATCAKKKGLSCGVVDAASFPSAPDIQSLAKCAAYMNNFNHKYGSHLLDNGYTHHTVNKDELYYSSGNFQIGVHVQTAINENWDLSSYKAYRKSMKESKITNLIFKYDTTEIQKLELSEMRTRAFSTRCVDLLRSFIGGNTSRETFEETAKIIMPFLEKMRGF